LASDASINEVWLPIIGRALAQLCLQAGQTGAMTIAEKARFLEALGLDRKDVADMLGTTAASVTELLRQAKNRKKGAKARGAKKKKTR
jgi:CRP-like cAMP-binding protein